MQEEQEKTYLPYVSLHNNTSFSLMDSLIEPAELFQRAKELNQPAIAVTDHGTLAGVFESYKASKATGVKLIVGYNFYFVNDVKNQDERLRHLILLAKNKTGYQNLLKLNKIGFDNMIVSYKKVYPRIDWNLLKEYSEGLICTTACGAGIISQLLNSRDFEEAEAQAIKLKEIFGDDLVFELQPNALRRNINLYTDYVDQVFTNRQLKKLGEKLNIKLIAATDAHYVNPDQHESHDVWLAMGSGQPIFSGNRIKYNVADFYIKSGDEVKAFFERTWGEEFAQSLIDNSLEIAGRCEEPVWVDPAVASGKKNQLPRFPVEDEPDYEEFLAWTKQQNLDLPLDALLYRYRSLNGLEEKIKAGLIPEEDRQWCDNQLNEEFEVLEFRGFSSYMLITSDFLNWCRKNNVPVGPGRGSVGGSLSAYLTGIHQAYPKKYGMIFSRFLNREKEAMPDCDNDIESQNRYRLEQYLTQKYGKDKIAHVSNIMTMKPKVYAKSITRTFDLAGDRKESVVLGQKLADLISVEYSKVTSALEGSPLFNEYANKYKPLRQHAKNLEKKKMVWSTHAAGVVITSDPLIDYYPLRIDRDHQLAVEVNKDSAEEIGLVKIDLLGLETLDIAVETERLIKKGGRPVPNIDLEAYDQKTYDLISSGETFCVFQLGTSGGTMDLARKIKPKSISDLADINALARPSAKDIRENFIKTKSGELPVNIKDPMMERAYRWTLGFPLYEECLMFMAADVAGWDLHKADSLRKMVKDKGKNPDKEKKTRDTFIQDMSKKHNLTIAQCEKFWKDNIESYGSYAFNRSHAVLYSLLSYQTAYLKAHYPAEFLLANLKSKVAKKREDDILKIKEELKNLNTKIVPPDINISETDYTIAGDNIIMTGLSALKYVSDDAIQNILQTRPFTSFEDFLSKTNSSKVRSSAIQALAAAGCFDSIANGLSRKQMFLYASDFKKKFQVFAKNKAKNPAKYTTFDYPWPKETEWTIPEIFALEKKYLGEGLTGDKTQVYPRFFLQNDLPFKELNKLLPPPPSNLSEADLRKHQKFIERIKGEVKQIFEFTVKKEDSKIYGQKMGKMLVEDTFGNQLSVTLFPDTLETFKKRIAELSNKKLFLAPGLGVLLDGNIQYYEGEIGVIANTLKKIAPPPAEPKELKGKKVIMERVKKTKVIDLEEADRNDIMDDLEDELAYGESGELDE